MPASRKEASKVLESPDQLKAYSELFLEGVMVFKSRGGRPKVTYFKIIQGRRPQS